MTLQHNAVVASQDVQGAAMGAHHDVPGGGETAPGAGGTASCMSCRVVHGDRHAMGRFRGGYGDEGAVSWPTMLVGDPGGVH